MAYTPPYPAVAAPIIISESIVLDTKPTVSLECSQVESVGETGYANVLVVFLNGLVAPKSFWLPVMRFMVRRLNMDEFLAGLAMATAKGVTQWKDPSFTSSGGGGSGAPAPQLLAYDRFGQGMTTDRDPSDEGKEEGYGHDILEVVRDLHQLIKQVTAQRPKRRIMFVANSIGCAIARLYAQEYPGSVAAMLLLDSIMANSDFVSIFPDPDSPGFDAGSLPSGVTPEILRDTRAKFRAVFHPSVKNAESLDRRNLATLLPDADKPSLREQGYDGKPPFVRVVGHDPDYFAKESLEGSMETPLAISMNYINPAWHRYNEGLAKLTDPKMASGPIIAHNCGHFIQKDDYGFVADLAYKLLRNIAYD